MYRSAQPSPMTFLVDRTHQTIQQQNIASGTPISKTPNSSKTHNPYGASVIPENPDEVMMQRSLSQLDNYSLTGRSPIYPSQYGGHSPFASSSFAEFPMTSSPLMIHGSMGHMLSPFDLPLDVTPKQPLTKVYVGGRPVAVPSVQTAERLATPTASIVPAVDDATPAPIIGDAIVRVAFRRTEARYLMRDISHIFGSPVRDVQQLQDVTVMVEGDRGEDLGCITEVEEILTEDRALPKMPLVKRIASREEITRSETSLRQEELRALEYAQQQVQRLFPGEPLSIEDATFQFDKQKLTLWYRVPDRVYFVPLLKALNSAYRCRIWMERVEA